MVSLTPTDLDRAKRLLREEDDRIQALTLNDLLAIERMMQLDGYFRTPVTGTPWKFTEIDRDVEVTPCAVAAAKFVIACVLLSVQSSELSEVVPTRSIEVVAKIIEAELPEIERLAKVFTDPEASLWAKATAVFEVVNLILNGGMLYEVAKAIFASLSWAERAYMITKLLAAVTIALASDGAAVIAELVVESTEIAALAEVAAQVVSQCKDVSSPRNFNDRIIAVLKDGTLRTLEREQGTEIKWQQLGAPGSVVTIQCEGSRVGYLTSDNILWVFEGALTDNPTREHPGVLGFCLSGDRIGYVGIDNSEPRVKEGGLSTGWTTEYSAVEILRLAGNRIGIYPKSDAGLKVKQGGLSANWNTMAYPSTIPGFQITENSVGYVSASNRFWLWEGAKVEDLKKQAQLQAGSAIADFALSPSLIAMKYQSGVLADVLAIRGAGWSRDYRTVARNVDKFSIFENETATAWNRVGYVDREGVLWARRSQDNQWFKITEGPVIQFGMIATWTAALIGSGDSGTLRLFEGPVNNLKKVSELNDVSSFAMASGRSMAHQAN